MSVEEKLASTWDRIFKWIGKRGASALPLGLIGYLLLLGIGVYGLLNGWPPVAKRWIILKAFYGLLTIGAPLFFFCEYLVRSDRIGNESAADRTVRLKQLKDIQDQGRAVWVACATIVGLILFKAS